MTMRGFGRVSPIQRSMLMIAGLASYGYDDNPNDEDYLANIKQGRNELIESTGVDFGYSLLNWHDYLLSHNDLCQDYTYCDTDDFHFFDQILQAVNDSRWTRLVKDL